jgi:UDP-glucose 4-epimerase
MRFLITGGAGFIGSHLAETLLAAGHCVTILDDLSTGSVSNIAHLKGDARFQCIVDTVLNRRLLARLVEDCDAVFHLAAAVGVKLIVESPIRTIATNIEGTEAVLECASKKGKKTVVASTSEVYGKAAKIPFSEDDDIVLGPTVKSRWSYACSKAVDEFLALAYWKERKLPVVIARPFNTVGPRQTARYGMVLPTFVHQALTGQPITVHGDGAQSRSFIHVKDTVAALIQLARHPAAIGQVFNIGSQTEVTIGRLAALIKGITQSCSEIHCISYDEAYEEGFEDVPRRVPDTTKINRVLNWAPTLSLEEIVRDVIIYVRDNGSAEFVAGNGRNNGAPVLD